jgi:hypothetical protein
MQFGPCTVVHIVASDGALVWLDSAITITIEAAATTTLHMWTTTSGQILTNNPPSPTYPNLVIQGAVSISAFAVSEWSGSIIMAYTSITGASYVTGQKYIVTMNGVMSTLGNGQSYLPGSAAGTISNGGQYPG